VSPQSGVIADTRGNLYGTTSTGVVANAGVVYKVDSTGRQTALYSFTGGADGGNPNAGVVRDPEGNLYGTTCCGGTAGAGVVYKVDTSGKETVLYSFTGGADGSDPVGVILDSAGDLYGATWSGGSANAGLLYKLDTAGNETVLYDFTGGADGANPRPSLIRDSAGNLYGTAAGGGAEHDGVVFKLNTTGHLIVLHNFRGGTDGSDRSSV